MKLEIRDNAKEKLKEYNDKDIPLRLIISGLS